MGSQSLNEAPGGGAAGATLEAQHLAGAGYEEGSAAARPIPRPPAGQREGSSWARRQRLCSASGHAES
jgi:hypothetical protein